MIAKNTARREEQLCPKGRALLDLFGKDRDNGNDLFQIFYVETKKFGVPSNEREDVIHGFYIQMAEHAGIYKYVLNEKTDPKEDRLKKWLFPSFRHYLLNYIRMKKNRSYCDLSEIDVPIDDDPSEDFIKREDSCEVKKALKNLTDLQREAIKMYYIEGMSYREMADKLGVPVSTIKGRMMMGYRTLRRDSELAEAVAAT